MPLASAFGSVLALHSFRCRRLSSLALLLLFLTIDIKLTVTAGVVPTIFLQLKELFQHHIKGGALLFGVRQNAPCELGCISVQRALGVVIQIKQLPVQRPFNER